MISDDSKGVSEEVMAPLTYDDSNGVELMNIG